VPVSDLCEELGLQPTVFHRWQKEFFEIHARERGTPSGRDRIDWKLMTDLPIASRKDAVEKLRWYAMRWKIETFHKILKSGCKAEESKLRTAERLINLIAVLVFSAGESSG